MSLIKPLIRDEELINEVRQHKNDTQRFHLWWLGQSGFLLAWDGKLVLFDPYLSDSLTEKYKNTDKPHVRMSELVVKPELLKELNIVTSSHNHTDHLDGETLIPILKNNPSVTFIIPEANRAFVAARVGCDNSFPVGLDAGATFREGEFTFFGVPAAHNEIEKDEDGRHKFMGYVVRFGTWTIYHSGDTLWYEGMEDLLKPFNLDVALLPINGNDPARRVAGNLDAAEAALLGRKIGAKMVIPCHYDMFTFNTADPKSFVTEAKKLNQPYTVLQPGGRFEYA